MAPVKRISVVPKVVPSLSKQNAKATTDALISSIQAETSRARNTPSMPKPSPQRMPFRVAPRPLTFVRGNATPSSTSFDIGAAVSDALDILTKSMSNTYIIVSVLIVAIVVISHGPTLNTGPFRDYINNNKVNNTLLTWVDNNALKFYGFLTFFPALYSIPSASRTVASIATFLWVLLVPEYTVFEYIIQSIALYIFFKTNKMNTRTIVVIFTIVAYYLGYLALAPPIVHGSIAGCYDPAGVFQPESVCRNFRVCYDFERTVIPCPGATTTLPSLQFPNIPLF